MNYSDFKITLDIHKTTSQAMIHAKKGDTARRIIVSLAENGKPYHITEDCRADFSATKSSGAKIVNGCSIDNNLIYYVLTPQTTAEVGTVDSEIRLYGADDKLLTTASFSIVVDDTNYDAEAEIESEQEVNYLASLISDATESIQKCNTLVEETENKVNSGAFNGADGNDGVSASHSWDGTVLTITSASGTSSADLKGDKGEKGEKGDQGIQGERGIQGISGVYVGSGDMPEGYNVQIDPTGDAELFAGEGVSF